MKGDELAEKGNKFIGYTLVPSSYQQVQEAYTKVKLLHPAADHVTCAMYMKEVDLFAQDYCDDGEHGAGRYLLDYLLQNKLKQRAVFVVRYFGSKLNAHRFACIKHAAVTAVQKNPENPVMGLNQEAIIDTPVDLQNPTNSPQSRQRRIRLNQSRGRGDKRSRTPAWNRGKHVPSNMRGAKPHYNYRGRGTGQYQHGHRGRGGPNRGNKRKYDFNHNTARRSRYSDFFGADVENTTPQEAQQQYEDWSNENNGSFDDTN